MEFDPYHKWLGIPPRQQPPHHYRLLGLALFECDPDVISHAAEERLSHLRSHEQGPHCALARQLTAEIEAAQACLLSVPQRTAYDFELRLRMPIEPAAPRVDPFSAAAPIESSLPPAHSNPFGGAGSPPASNPDVDPFANVAPLAASAPLMPLPHPFSDPGNYAAPVHLCGSPPAYAAPTYSAHTPPPPVFGVALTPPPAPPNAARILLWIVAGSSLAFVLLLLASIALVASLRRDELAAESSAAGEPTGVIAASGSRVASPPFETTDSSVDSPDIVRLPETTEPAAMPMVTLAPAPAPRKFDTYNWLGRMELARDAVRPGWREVPTGLQSDPAAAPCIRIPGMYSYDPRNKANYTLTIEVTRISPRGAFLVGLPANDKNLALVIDDRSASDQWITCLDQLDGLPAAQSSWATRGEILPMNVRRTLTIRVRHTSIACTADKREVYRFDDVPARIKPSTLAPALADEPLPAIGAVQGEFLVTHIRVDCHFPDEKLPAPPPQQPSVETKPSPMGADPVLADSPKRIGRPAAKAPKSIDDMRRMLEGKSVLNVLAQVRLPADVLRGSANRQEESLVIAPESVVRLPRTRFRHYVVHLAAERLEAKGALILGSVYGRQRFHLTLDGKSPTGKLYSGAERISGSYAYSPRREDPAWFDDQVRLVSFLVDQPGSQLQIWRDGDRLSQNAGRLSVSLPESWRPVETSELYLATTNSTFRIDAIALERPYGLIFGDSPSGSAGRPDVPPPAHEPLLFAASEEHPWPAVRAPLPPRIEQALAQERIEDELYDHYLAATTRSARLTLAAKLHAASRRTDSPGLRHELLRAAAQAAGSAGDYRLMFAILDDYSRWFDSTGYDLAFEVVESLDQATESMWHAAIMSRAYLELADRAIGEQQLFWAEKAITLGQSRAVRFRGQSQLASLFTRKSSDRRNIETKLRALQPAREILLTRPDDPAANLAWGRFVALSCGNFPRGLAHLGKGPHQDPLVQLALRDLVGGKGSAALAALGDAWAEQANSLFDFERRHAEERASFWYQQALQDNPPPDVELFARKYVQARLRQSADYASTNPVRLLGEIVLDDMPDWPHVGPWKRIPESRAIGVDEPADHARIWPPLDVYGEFKIDLGVANRPTKGLLFVVIPVRGRSCAFVLDLNRKICGLSNIDGRSHHQHASSQRLDLANLNALRMLSVRVDSYDPSPTQATVSAKLNDKQIFTWTGKAESLSLPPEYALDAPQRIGIGIDRGTLQFEYLTIQFNGGHGTWSP